MVSVCVREREARKTCRRLLLLTRNVWTCCLSVLRLLCDEKEHRSEEILLSTFDQSISSNLQELLSLNGTLGSKTDSFQDTAKVGSGETTELGHSHRSKDITHGLAFTDITFQRIEPLDAIAHIGQVLMHFNLETNVLESLKTFCNLAHLRDTIAFL